MPNTNVVAGSPSTLTIGTTGTYAQGLIQSARNLRTGEKLTFAGNDGWTAVAIWLDHRNEIQVEVLVDNTVTTPTRGSSITIDGKTGYVDDCEVTYSNKDAKRLSIRATAYDGIAA